MLHYSVCEINPGRDFINLSERILRLPQWRRRKALSFSRDSDRLQCAMAYELTARLIKMAGGPERFVIDYDPQGKPYIREMPRLFLSISHCQKAVMAAVADAPVGCDVEEIALGKSTDNGLVADYCYSDAEKSLIRNSDSPEVEFTRLWTVKEALYKMDNSLSIEALDTAAGMPGCLIETKVASGYVATLALNMISAGRRQPVFP